MRLIVGISGATGAIYGIRTLQALKACQIESHLVLTNSARKTIEMETVFTVKEVESLADYVHDNRDIGASISSGSFKTHGMIIAPCAIKSLSALANSYNDSLLVRAADVVLKERRKLVVIPRETPLHLGHLKLLTVVSPVVQTLGGRRSFTKTSLSARFINLNRLKEIRLALISYGRGLETSPISFRLYFVFLHI